MFPIKTTSTIKRSIYAYTLPTVPDHNGYVKIGDTVKESQQRIKEQLGTAGIVSDILWTKRARKSDGSWFRDYDLHRFLTLNRIPKNDFGTSANEWFFFNGMPEKADELTEKFIANDYEEVQVGSNTDYILRKEQSDAVAKALEFFTNTKQGEFLWNAKPRFGKTITTYDLAQKITKEKNMKFDVIIGNPPYQEKDGGAQSSAMPIYHNFVLQAIKLNPQYYTMIIPSRWFAGGKGLDSFRDEMLKDNRIRVLHDFIRADELFPNVEIKGGVCYFLWDRNNRGNCKVSTHLERKIISTSERPLLEKGADTFIRYNEAIPILKKIQSKQEKSFSEIVRPAMTFGFRTFFKDFDLNSHFEGGTRVYANQSQGYIKRKRITQSTDWIDRWKVIIPEAIGVGNMAKDILKPIISEPNSINTETYIMNGPYNSEAEAKNVVSYINTKFFHFLLGLKKISQHTTAGTYFLIPLQDFTEEWTDAKLYKKYSLTSNEIDFIESMIRPMDFGREEE